MAIIWFVFRIIGNMAKGKKAADKSKQTQGQKQGGAAQKPRVSKEIQIEQQLEEIRRREAAKERAWDKERDRKRAAALEEKTRQKELERQRLEAQKQAMLRQTDLEAAFSQQDVYCPHTEDDCFGEGDSSQGYAAPILEGKRELGSVNTTLTEIKATIKPSVIKDTGNGQKLGQANGTAFNFSGDPLVNGIIMAEILNPPKVLRRK